MFDWLLYRILPRKKKDVVPIKGTRLGGALPDIKDPRDFRSPLMASSLTSPIVFPDSLNLEDYNLTQVENQNNYNACVSHAITTSIETYSLNNGWKHYFELSRMYHWYYGRKLSGTYPENAGMYIRDGWKVAQGDTGISIEKLCPYQTLDYNQEPGLAAKIFRKWHVPFTYYWIDGGTKEEVDYSIKKILNEKKVPIVFGMGLTPSFFSANSKEVYKPQANESVQFYHAMCIIGYDVNKNAYLIRNSWGYTWGVLGNIWVDKDYFLATAYNLSYPDKVTA